MIGQAERLFELRNLEKKVNLAGKKNIIAFTSGKGGTGKTFLSLNIAYALSSQNKKVLLIDFDLNFANSNILLNLIPQVTLNGFLSGKKLFSEVITEYSEYLHFIFGESGENHIELNNEMILRFYNNLADIKENYDFIFVDTASGGQKELIKLISLTDANIIVTTAEPTSVMDAYVIIKLLSKEEYAGINLVAINKSNNVNEAAGAFNNVKTAAIHFLGEVVEYLGCINNDEAVSRSIIDQELLLKKYPSYSISKHINKAAHSLADIIQMANIHHKENS